MFLVNFFPLERSHCYILSVRIYLSNIVFHICAEEVRLLLHNITVTLVYNFPRLFTIATLYVYHFYILHIFYILK